MTIRLGSTVINVADVELMTRFWAQALGLSPSSEGHDDDFRVLRGSHGRVSLQRAETPVTARDQMHLDLYTDDHAAEVSLDDLPPTFTRDEGLAGALGMPQPVVSLAAARLGVPTAVLWGLAAHPDLVELIERELAARAAQPG